MEHETPFNFKQMQIIALEAQQTINLEAYFPSK